jgi:hypothetical protein
MPGTEEEKHSLLNNVMKRSIPFAQCGGKPRIRGSWRPVPQSGTWLEAANSTISYILLLNLCDLAV